jgi:hypothetical protein
MLGVTGSWQGGTPHVSPIVIPSRHRNRAAEIASVVTRARYLKRSRTWLLVRTELGERTMNTKGLVHEAYAR